MPTLTIDFTAPVATRLETAYGSFLGLGRDATQAEIKADLIEHMKRVVKGQERDAGREASDASLPADIDAT